MVAIIVAIVALAVGVVAVFVRSSGKLSRSRIKRNGNSKSITDYSSCSNSYGNSTGTMILQVAISCDRRRSGHSDSSSQRKIGVVAITAIEVSHESSSRRRSSICSSSHDISIRSLSNLFLDLAKVLEGLCR